MDTLPTEIIYHIFSFLPRSSLYSCFLVNDYWHECSQAVFYEKVPVPSPDKLYGLLTIFTKRHKVNGSLGKCVKWLDITTNRCDLPISPQTELSKLLLLCPNIERIDMDNFLVPVNSDQHIPLNLAISLASCLKLHRLECNGLIPFTASDSTRCNLPNLTYLRLWLPEIKAANLEELAITYPKLGELHLRGRVEGPFPYSQSLKFTISSISTLVFCLRNLDSSWVAHLALRYPKLKRISIEGPRQREAAPHRRETTPLRHETTDIVDFCAFAQNCSYLSEFSCSGSYAPTATFFEMLSQSSAGKKGLQKLNVYNSSNFADQDLHKATTCFGQSLSSLILHDCDKITSDGLNAALGSCQNLTDLMLFSKKAKWEIQLSRLMSHCYKLETLKLASEGITCSASTMCSSLQTHLKNVQLTSVPTWPVVLDYISAYCPNVSHIGLVDLYILDQKDTYIVDLPNHHIRDLIIEPFYYFNFPKKDWQYLIKIIDGFKANTLPRTRWFLFQYLGEDVYKCEWAHKLVEPEDAVSKFVNLEIRIGQLDNCRLSCMGGCDY